MLAGTGTHAAYEYAEYSSDNLRFLVVLSEALLKSSGTVKVTKSVTESVTESDQTPITDRRPKVTENG
eukprot:8970572-Pyramimonas_sp.AAC.1